MTAAVALAPSQEAFDLTPMADLDLVAVFTRVSHAVSFIERYSPLGEAAYLGMVRKGRTVSWTVPAVYADAHRTTLFLDLLENVGYHGSPPIGKQATLNGVPAPRSY